MQITVWQDGKSYSGTAACGERLTDILRRLGAYLPAPCGGNGRCGNCRVQFTHGAPPPSDSDLQKLAPKQIAEGWRLACTAYVRENGTVVIPTAEQLLAEKSAPQQAAGAVGIAIDLGTTTLAAALVDVTSGQTLAVQTAINRQRSFGADVLSRIQAAGNGHAEALRSTACNDIDALVAALLQETGTPPAQVEQVVIAANTTMQHLLCGLDTTALGVAPFTPVTCSPKPTPYSELTGHATVSCPVSFVPGASAFIGGDVIAGLIACDFDRTTQPRLFMDIGTNGELVLAEGDRYMATSVAAGPAFEGGRLSCGVGGVAGAICRVSIRTPNVQYEAIGHQPPLGLCGTGAVEALCALRRAGIVDKTGRLSPLFPEGYPLAEGVVLTQADIRELQMAKAAVLAGVMLLLKRNGLGATDVGKALLAGGFGTQLNVPCAQELGMLPRELSAEAVGNTALVGAIRCLCRQDELARAATLAAKIEEYTLANDPAFEQTYMQAMEL